MHQADATGNPREWRGGAACLHHDPDLFFPEGTAGPALRQVDQAKWVCHSCPVRTPCLGFALRHRSRSRRPARWPGARSSTGPRPGGRPCRGPVVGFLRGS
jgi:hypothetical protein